jgi:hypothetical protein
MKRLYIIHESAWESPVQFDHSSGPLWSSFEGKGCCWWDLGKGFVELARGGCPPSPSGKGKDAAARNASYTGSRAQAFLCSSHGTAQVCIGS